jgi:hypothetical protein
MLVVVATLTMTKIQILSAKIENKALLLATYQYIKHKIENTIVTEVK